MSPLENWLPLFLLLILVSFSLSFYTLYLRRKFNFNPISMKKVFKSPATSPYRFGEVSNSKIRTLAKWEKIALVLYSLSGLSTFVFLISIFIEFSSEGSIDNAFIGIIVVSFTFFCGTSSYVIEQKKLTLQLKEYRLLRKGHIDNSTKDFFEGKIPLLSLKMLNLGIVNLVFLWAAVFVLIAILTFPNFG